MDVANRYTRSRGFSVVELITTLAVMVTLISVGVPAWQNLVAGNTVTSARILLASTLALARQTAVESGQNLTLCPSSDQQVCSGDYRAWHEGIILFFDQNADRQRTPNEPIVRVIGPQTGLAIQSSSGRRSIRYAPDGSAWGSNMTLRFCSGEGTTHNRAIILYGSGRARFASRLGNGNPITCL